MFIAMRRRAENNMEAYFDLFNVFKSNLWLTILLAFVANTLLGFAFRLFERRYISKKPMAPLNVNFIFIRQTIKILILAHLSNVSSSNWQRQ